jgi:hypothetical protein
MEEDQRKKRSQLFTVRVWVEHFGPGQAEWRGQVRHVLSGESHSFRHWETLIDFLMSKGGDSTTEIGGDDADLLDSSL